MAKYRITVPFEASGERTYIIEADSKRAAYDIFNATQMEDIQPETEEWQVDRELSEWDEVAIDRVKEGE